MTPKRAIRKKRYPVVDGDIAIEIKLNYVNQLFDIRDPAPFREKDLDDDAVEYMVSSVQELSAAKVHKLLIFIAKDKEDSSQVIDTKNAIHQFFKYESERMSTKIHATLKNGIKSLLIGLGFLTFAILMSMLIPSDSKTFWSLIFKEGLLLMGWVSMWKPINIFLYDWWPLSDLKKVYICLSNVEVDFIYLLKQEEPNSTK